MKIAIHQNPKVFDHSTDWGKEWVRYCRQTGIEYGIVDCFAAGIVEVLHDYDALLWNFSNYSPQAMMVARSVLYSAEQMGLHAFPDFRTAWHYDDKIAETYLLQSIQAPMPKSWVFYSSDSATRFFESHCRYPVVAKLKCGSGSNNVMIIRDKGEAVKYVRTMFGHGVSPVPSLLFKAGSNIRSARDWRTFVARFKRIPEFMRTRRRAQEFPNERGYVLVQEFVPNDGYDLKVVVVGDKLSFCVRSVRRGDFRASGGGSISYDKSLMTDEIRRTAFRLSDQLGSQSMGYDFVVDKRDGVAKVVELSYAFSHEAQIALGGHWDRQGRWSNEPLNAPVEILQRVVSELHKTP